MKSFQNLKRHQWIIAGTTVIGILGSIVITGFFMWGEIKSFNTNKEIVDTLSDNSWQTYTNNDYFYSIQYPSDWSVNNWSNIIQILPPGEKSTGQYSSGPTISIVHVDQIDTLNTDETNKIYINNMVVTKWEFANDVDTYVNLYFPRPEGGFIRIYWLKSLENKHKNFWEIIESITILNDDRPEWELYTDYELGISFRYPKLKWGKINVLSMKESDHNDNVFKSGKAKIIKFNKYYGASLSAFSNNFSHMYYQDPYLGGQNLSKTCTNEKILTDTGICKNINVGNQSTYENITDFGYECSFVDSRRISLNLDQNGYSGMLISQALPSSQNCGSLEIENMNEINRTKDLTDQYNRENLQKSDLTNLELMDQVLSSFKFLN